MTSFILVTLLLKPEPFSVPLDRALEAVLARSTAFVAVAPQDSEAGCRMESTRAAPSDSARRISPPNASEREGVNASEEIAWR